MISSISSLPLTSLPASTSSQATTSGGSFGSFLSNAINNLNQTVSGSESQGVNLAAGKSVGIEQAMVAATQAQLVVELTVQVRNRVVDAYNQVMNMQV